MKNVLSFILILFVALPVFSQDKNSEEAKQDQESNEEKKKETGEEAAERRAPVVNKLIGDPEKIESLEKKDQLALLRHKQMYFAYGVPLTKIQLSFKSPMIENVPFYFGYSQVIFWRLREDSKPFEDATYNPELFYRYPIKGNALKSIDFGIWEHNSNGKGGAISRSYDQSFVKLNYATEAFDWVTEFSGKLTYIYNKDETNADIYDYISPFEFSLRFIQLFDSVLDKGELSIDFNPGGRYAHRWERGGYQIGFSFRLGGLKFVPAFYVQYFHGYAETLINYDQKVDQYRAGFVF